MIDIKRPLVATSTEIDVTPREATFIGYAQIDGCNWLVCRVATQYGPLPFVFHPETGRVASSHNVDYILGNKEYARYMALLPGDSLSSECMSAGPFHDTLDEARAYGRGSRFILCVRYSGDHEPVDAYVEEVQP